MNRSTLRRLALVAAALVAVAVVASPARAEPEFATITGHITDGGAPVVGARITAIGQALGFGQGITDADGRYEMTVTPDTYYVLIYSRGFVQYAYGQRLSENATLFEVTAGVTVTVDDTLLPHGTVTGRFVDSAGQGVAANVGTFTPNLEFGSFDGTDPTTGEFALDVYPGDFVLQFALPGGQAQWAFGKPEGTGDPDIFTVGVGETVVVNDTLAPTGSLAGRVTEADGTPVEGASVVIQSPVATSVFATTDADGRYEVDRLFTGAYRVNFGTTDGRSQWAHGRTSFETADDVVVTEGATTTVDEVLRALGSLRVQARVAGNHAPIAEFCVQAASSFSNFFTCTTDGTVLVPKAPIGWYEILTYVEGGPYANVTSHTRVRLGQQAAVTADLPRAGTIHTTVRDRRTRGTVAEACFQVVPVGGRAEEGGWCTDELGRVTVDHLSPGDYQIFVSSPPEGYGMQWVGEQGGVGMPTRARVIHVTAGGSVDLPPILLDRPGTIAGTITDATTGLPLAGACATVSPRAAGPTFCDDAHYVLDRLGPYPWQLQFSADSHSWEWYSDAANRFLATPVNVDIGQTVTIDATLLPGGATLRGRIVDPAGRPVEGGIVTVVNVATGDPAASSAAVGSDGTFEVGNIAQQSVRVVYQGPFRPTVLYQGGAGIWLPRNGTKTITFTVPAG
jgi:hypothetical protein